MNTLLPRLQPETYIYACVNDDSYRSWNTLFTFHEAEGTTIIISEEEAIKHRIPFEQKWSWICLDFKTQLTAVGITAQFSKVLSDAKIPCNVIAGFYHDHIFVPENEGEKALSLLSEITI